MTKAPNQRDIAKAAGVCPATVSLALRNHPSIPEATRKRIRQVAESLGYRPNPRVAELMGQIRKNRSTDALTETVALVWADVSGQLVQQRRHMKNFEEGVTQRLVENGYEVVIWYKDEQIRLERVGQILRNRGIRGVILAPLMRKHTMAIDWDWSNLSVVITGSASWSIEFNRVRFHHFQDMRNLVHHIRRQGKQRTGLVTHSWLEDHSQRSIDGGFWSALPPELKQEYAIFEVDIRGEDALPEWVRSYQPDSLILDRGEALTYIETLPDPPAIYLRNLNEGPETGPFPGLRQSYTYLGQVAAEQLIAQLQLNQFGLPASPTQTLITGEIVEA